MSNKENNKDKEFLDFKDFVLSHFHHSEIETFDQYLDSIGLESTEPFLLMLYDFSHKKFEEFSIDENDDIADIEDFEWLKPKNAVPSILSSDMVDKIQNSDKEGIVLEINGFQLLIRLMQVIQLYAEDGIQEELPKEGGRVIGYVRGIYLKNIHRLVRVFNDDMEDLKQSEFGNFIKVLESPFESEVNDGETYRKVVFADGIGEKLIELLSGLTVEDDCFLDLQRVFNGETIEVPIKMEIKGNVFIDIFNQLLTAEAIYNYDKTSLRKMIMANFKVYKPRRKRYGTLADSYLQQCFSGAKDPSTADKIDISSWF